MRPNLRAHLPLILAVACLCCLVSSGCGGGSAKDPNKLGAQYDPLFASADEETKVCWQTATGALQTNGYAVTILAVRTMLQTGKLTPEQAQAARETATAASDKMYEAANKGDAQAVQAIEELRKATGR